MATKGPIKPIIAKHLRDRYIADLSDLSAYKNQNCGFSWILVCLDLFTKFGIAKPLKSKFANDVASTSREIFTTFWPPILLHTDNRAEFKNGTLESICHKYDIKKILGRARCPWIQGQVERFKQSIKRWLSSIGSTNYELGKWQICLNDVIFLNNNTVHSTTKQIPAKLFFGTAYPKKVNDDLVSSLSTFDPELSDEVETSHESAKVNTSIAAEIMAQKRRWKYDIEHYYRT
ncbi:putative transposable element [Pseudoloma neurophilia]|uniref:Putative transposable element n=1 Tax=Pseudoloma neurophilia TaxID=146866 RepID=A0A0R0M0A8_9MICR|nr:putative transposable element [Pseudoloma neurophilia]